MHNSKIIAITPEMERRILGERRAEPRERIAKLEKRLAAIAELLERMGMTHGELYCLAIGADEAREAFEKDFPGRDFDKFFRRGEQ